MNISPLIASRPKSSKATIATLSALKVSAHTINGLAQVFKLLADESRLKILLALAQDGELHVTALCDMLNRTHPADRHQTQPAVSHHLTLLRMAGLVGYRRNGKHNFYRLESGLVAELLEQFFTDSGDGHNQIQFEQFSLSYKRK